VSLLALPALRLVERNYVAYRRNWIFFVTGFFEPFFYLLSISVGVQELVGDVQGLEYAEFVAPGLLAASAMNAAMFDSIFQVFFRLKYAHTYEGMLATPLDPLDVAGGEMTWTAIRGALYSLAFLLIMLAMGLVGSWWAVLAVPAAVLTGIAFSGLGMSASTFLRSWQDFDLIQLVLLPMFLLSTTFFPLATYPRALELLVQVTPLYHAVSLLRDLCVGWVTWGSLWHVVYLLVLAAFGLRTTARRFGGLLLG
jgi:lipooligosaccharide transport system permease protein